MGERKGVQIWAERFHTLLQRAVVSKKQEVLENYSQHMQNTLRWRDSMRKITAGHEGRVKESDKSQGHRKLKDPQVKAVITGILSSNKIFPQSIQK